MHTFIVTFCFHIEFHRMATVINCCEFKKLKILKDKSLLRVICCSDYVLSPKSLLGEICAGIMEKYQKGSWLYMGHRKRKKKKKFGRFS